MKVHWTHCRFEDIPLRMFDEYKKESIFIDIDHTLIAPSEISLKSEVSRRILELKVVSPQIYLVSNGGRDARNKEIADAHGIMYVKTAYKKPNSRIVEGLNVSESPVVIGDKLLIDGFFGRNIGAQCLLVERHVSSRDSWIDRILCVVDDCAVFLYSLFI